MSHLPDRLQWYLKLILYLEYTCALYVYLYVLYVIKPYMCKDIKYINMVLFENLQNKL